MILYYMHILWIFLVHALQEHATLCIACYKGQRMLPLLHPKAQRSDRTGHMNYDSFVLTGFPRA